jgi:DNA invertase Pin-like site-specific DNA recombinase
MTTIGYARVSTDGQTLQAQTEALHSAGCPRIFADKISGAYSDRPQLAKALAALSEGDTLIVTKLDRLARSTRDLLNTLDAIGKIGASFKSLNDPWADTTTPHGRLVLTVLGGLAELERHLILSRTAEGRTRAQANGVRFGRKPSLTPYQRAEALRRRAAGETLSGSADKSPLVWQSSHSKLTIPAGHAMIAPQGCKSMNKLPMTAAGHLALGMS